MTQPTAAEFYDAALANDGYYYLGQKAGKRLVKDRPSFDKRLGPKPDLYHSLARFRDADGGRKAENIISLRSMRLDVDTKQSHPKAPYDDLPEARVAVNDFVTLLGLPMPWLIDSGGGWHVYWMLDADVPHDEWRATADMLKTATVQAHLDNDRAIIADGTRLMRAVGSLHSGLGKEVSIVRRGAPACSHAAFRAIVEKFVGTATPAPASFSGNGQGNMLTNVKHADSFADAAADQCLLLNDFRAGKDQDYNLWIGALSNLHRMVDGDEKAHEWSKRQRPNEYDEALTDAKLNEFKGPHTCGKIAALSGAPCGSCPHYLANLSPVRLGEGGSAPQPAAVAPPPPPPGQPPVANPQPAPVPAPAPPPNGLPPPPLPYLSGNYPANGFVEIFPADPQDATKERFFWYYDKDPAGLKHPFKSTVGVRKGTAKKGPVITVIAEGAFFVTGMIHDAEHTLQCHFRHAVTFGTVATREKSFTLAPAEISGPTLLAYLGKHGFLITGLERARSMKAFINRWYDAARAHAPVAGGDVFGLQDSGDFIIGHHIVKTDGTIAPAAATGAAGELLGQFNQIQNTDPALLLAKAREWGRQTDNLFNHDELIAHQFIILCSFASMLWALDPGAIKGIIVSAFGTGTGLAKSSCVRVAGSVWGNDQYLMSSAGTVKAICGRAATLNSLPMAIDEVTGLKSFEVVQLISDLGNGMDRARLTQLATPRPIKEWRLITLMTSNDRLSGFGAGKQGAEGLNARLWEIPFNEYHPNRLCARLHRDWDAGIRTYDPADFENNRPDKVIANLSTALGGYAGMQFASDIMPRRDAIVQSLAAMVDTLNVVGASDPAGNRAAVKAGACVLLALSVLNKRKILSFDFAKMRDWIVTQLQGRSMVAQNTSYDPINEFLGAMNTQPVTVYRSDSGSGPVRETFDNRGTSAIAHRVINANGNVTEHVLYLFRSSLRDWFPDDNMTVLDTLRTSGRLLAERCAVPANLTDGHPKPESYKIDLRDYAVAAAPAAKPAPIAGTDNVFPLATG
jgi:hypothetical protein